MSKARDLANASSALSAVDATELGYLDGVTSAVQTQVDAKIAKTLTTTTGDIIYASGANTPARLGIGSSAQVLTVSGGVPAWAAATAGGKVLQMVSASTTTAVTNSTNTFADTTLTATITPTLDTSEILVLISQNGGQKSAGNAGNGIQINVFRGATDLGYITAGGLYDNSAQVFYSMGWSLSYLDSPATTSATTYKTQFKNRVAAASVSIQEGNETSTITLLEIGA